MLLVAGEFSLTLEAALANYDVIDATPEERELLLRIATSSVACSRDHHEGTALLRHDYRGRW